MFKPDRLSALITRFELSAELIDDPSRANLFLVADGESGDLSRLEFWPETKNRKDTWIHIEDELLVSAAICLGGETNPLARALPSRITASMDNDDRLKGLAQLIIGEVNNQHCGLHTVLQRLFEVVVITLLRQTIQESSNQIGLIAGLADSHVCKAIVAIHERPEFGWNIENLADNAGLSRSQFVERFKSSVGQTPAQYLREWRLTLAYQDLEKGERVKTVAQRYGYSSQEALSRAISRRYNRSPMKIRQQGLKQRLLNPS